MLAVRPSAVVASILNSEHEARRVFDALKSAGFVCVPRDPTQRMIEAAYWAAYEGDAAEVWEEMIGVACLD